jgi:hypothetical protein
MDAAINNGEIVDVAQLQARSLSGYVCEIDERDGRIISRQYCR